ncbi:MAG: hypothetical protein EAZ09_07325 [Oscillatoriales cyanobacterium]|nr:MAG: hypothetical protein EAZ09_07325 [Oscillatoriales cyanobacterium]
MREFSRRKFGSGFCNGFNGCQGCQVEGRKPFDASTTLSAPLRSGYEEYPSTEFILSPSATLRINCVEGLRVQRRKKEEGTIFLLQ